MSLTPSFPKQTLEDLVTLTALELTETEVTMQAAERCLQLLSPDDRKILIGKCFSDEIEALIQHEVAEAHKEGLRLGNEDSNQHFELELKEERLRLQQQLEELTLLLRNFSFDNLEINDLDLQQMYAWAAKACYQVLLYELKDPSIIVKQLTYLVKETIGECSLVVESHPAHYEVLNSELMRHPRVSEVVSNDSLIVGELIIRIDNGKIESSLPERLEQLHLLVQEQVQRLRIVGGAQ